MSATLQLELFTSYFADVPMAPSDTRQPVTSVHIPGAVHSVAEYFLEDVLLQTGYLSKVGAGTHKAAAVSKVQSAVVDSLRSQGYAVPTGMEGLDFSRLFPEEDLVADSLASADILDLGVGGTGRSATAPALGLGEDDDAELAGVARDVDYQCKLCKYVLDSVGDFATHVALCQGPGTVPDGLPQGKPAAPSSGDAQKPSSALSAEAFLDPSSAGSAMATTAARPPPPPVDAPTNSLGSLMAALATETEGRSRDKRGRLKHADAQEALEEAAESDPVQALLQQYMGLHDDENVDCDLITALVESIVQHQQGAARADAVAGAILVFLPGWDDISRTQALIEEHPYLNSLTWVLPLHSAIPTSEQRQVFRKPPKGKTKVVLSTNIAETSITIDDASARQRAGRAGRVRPGIAYHLFSRSRHAALNPHDIAEMLSTPLEELCLRVKALDLGDVQGLSGGGASSPGASRAVSGEIEAFMATAPEPPLALSVQRAVRLLVQLGALHQHTVAVGGQDCVRQRLTPLGRALLHMPVPPDMGKMILIGCLLGVLDPVLTIACTVSYRSPFALATRAGDQARATAIRASMSGGTGSDHLAMLGAFDGYAAAKRRGGMSAAHGYCRANFLSFPALMMVEGMRHQVLQELLSAKVVFKSEVGPRGFMNRSARQLEVVQAALAVGMYPRIARFLPQKPARFPTVRVDAVDSAAVHRSSLIGRTLASQTSQAQQQGGILVAYEELTRLGRKNTIRNLSTVPLLALLVLAGRDSSDSLDLSSLPALEAESLEQVLAKQGQGAKRPPSGSPSADSSDEDESLPGSLASAVGSMLFKAGRAHKRSMKELHVAHATSEAGSWNASAAAARTDLMTGGGARGAAAAVDSDGEIIASLAPSRPARDDELEESGWETVGGGQACAQTDAESVDAEALERWVLYKSDSRPGEVVVGLNSWLAYAAPPGVAAGMALLRAELSKAFALLILSRLTPYHRKISGGETEQASKVVSGFLDMLCAGSKATGHRRRLEGMAGTLGRPPMGQLDVDVDVDVGVHEEEPREEKRKDRGKVQDTRRALAGGEGEGEGVGVGVDEVAGVGEGEGKGGPE
ncbi:Dhx36, partial [Symbiodinium sp. KB8]